MKLVLCGCVVAGLLTESVQANDAASLEELQVQIQTLQRQNQQLQNELSRQQLRINKLEKLVDRLVSPGGVQPANHQKLKPVPKDAKAQQAAEAKRQQDLEQQRRRKLGADALARVSKDGQRISSSAYPLAIGGVDYNYDAELVGIASVKDGYQVTVRFTYTNILKKTFFLEIQLQYDQEGGFRSWTIANFNDPVPPKLNSKIFER